MVKCEFCDATIRHPRGEKAQEEGWTVVMAAMGRGERKLAFTIISCPKHTDKLVARYKEIVEDWQKHRGESGRGHGRQREIGSVASRRVVAPGAIGRDAPSFLSRKDKELPTTDTPPPPNQEEE